MAEFYFKPLGGDKKKLKDSAEFFGKLFEKCPSYKGVVKSLDGEQFELSFSETPTPPEAKALEQFFTKGAISGPATLNSVNLAAMEKAFEEATVRVPPRRRVIAPLARPFVRNAATHRALRDLEATAERLGR